MSFKIMALVMITCKGSVQKEKQNRSRLNELSCVIFRTHNKLK